MKKLFLMTPGPTPVPEEIMLKMATPIMHHRTKEFKALFGETRNLLKKLFQTQNDVVIFASSGTGAMEASVSNLLEPQEKAIIINAGKFGKRWGELVKAFDGIPVELSYPYGDYAKVDDIKKAIDRNPDVKAVFIQASETSTGVFHPIDEIGTMLKESYPEVLFVVDGITAIGCMDIKTDQWGVDIMITGSQKALMLPPGLSMLSVSEKAKEKIKKSKNRHYYFDILKELNADGGAYTPAVKLVEGLHEVLLRLLEEGLENVFKRHALLASATREAAKALGLKLLAKRPADSLTAILTPIDSSKIINLMKSNGVFVSNGQGELKNRIIRIAHLGYFDKPDTLAAIGALEMALVKLGISIELGSGVKRAMEIFLEQ